MFMRVKSKCAHHARSPLDRIEALAKPCRLLAANPTVGAVRFLLGSPSLTSFGLVSPRRARQVGVGRRPRRTCSIPSRLTSIRARLRTTALASAGKPRDGARRGCRSFSDSGSEGRPDSPIRSWSVTTSAKRFQCRVDCFAWAVWTVCSTSAWASPFGVPCSNRTSTGGNFGAQTLSHELEDGLHLFARHVELLDDLVDAEVFEVLNDGGHGQSGTLEHPRASSPVGDALDRRAL